MSIITGRRLDYFYKKLLDKFAKKSIYSDDTVNVGRKSGSTKGRNSFTCGLNATASGSYARSGGRNATAGGYNSSAFGDDVSANGDYAFSAGIRTTSDNFAATTFGKWNKTLKTGGNSNNQIGDAFVIGNGADSLSNALRITFAGDVLGTKAFQSSGADYAEFIKPWADGNIYNEDRIGYFVTIKDGLLYKARTGDYIAGITSGNPSVVGNADEDYYWRYERDEFSRIIFVDVPEMVQMKDENGNLVFDKESGEPIMVETGEVIKNAKMMLSKEYDPSLQETYVPRVERKEWDYVGMRGVIAVRDDGTCISDHYCKCGKDGIATFAEERDFDRFYVVERVSEGVVRVII